MRIIQLLRFVWFRDDKGSTSTLITSTALQNYSHNAVGFSLYSSSLFQHENKISIEHEHNVICYCYLIFVYDMHQHWLFRRQSQYLRFHSFSTLNQATYHGIWSPRISSTSATHLMRKGVFLISTIFSSGRTHVEQKPIKTLLVITFVRPRHYRSITNR